MVTFWVEVTGKGTQQGLVGALVMNVLFQIIGGHMGANVVKIH